VGACQVLAGRILHFGADALGRVEAEPHSIGGQRGQACYIVKNLKKSNWRVHFNLKRVWFIKTSGIFVKIGF